MKFRRALVLLAFAATASVRAQPAGDAVAIMAEPDAGPRIVYGTVRLGNGLHDLGLTVQKSSPEGGSPSRRQIFVGRFSDPRIRPHLEAGAADPGPEGFILTTDPTGVLVVAGADDSGVLYGCLELARRARTARSLPAKVSDREAPAFRLRGPCIGMQKTTILPGYSEYEYPYTPELFPFFYDKEFWKGYLDFLADNRMNTLYLWSGHPFPSLVKLPDYPYALEVSEEGYRQNVEMYRYLIQEADKRGIWLVQMFYNIELSKPFAEHNHLPTHLEAPSDLAADYTRKSITEFVRQYPQVGLMTCLGEALQGIDNQVSWFTQVILPAYKDGLAAAGITTQPPFILRTHGTDASVVLPAALKVYPRIDTEEKFNGESLTTWQPRGSAQALHLEMSKLAETHIANVHLLANLEPFRYGAQRFLRQAQRPGHARPPRREGRPCLSPSPTGTGPTPRTSWPHPLRCSTSGTGILWIRGLGALCLESGCARDGGPCLLDRAPGHRLWARRGGKHPRRLQRLRRGRPADHPPLRHHRGQPRDHVPRGDPGPAGRPHEVPRQCPALGNPWPSRRAPPGVCVELLTGTSNPTAGDPGPASSGRSCTSSEQAEKEIDAAAAQVTANADEFGRLLNDIHCIREMALNYAAKAQAAMLVLRYGHSHDVGDMEKAAVLLGQSLDHYRALARLTAETYLYAQSMQTNQRAIPVKGGINGRRENYHWTQLVLLYEKELVISRPGRRARASPSRPGPAEAGRAQFVV